jgi:hypothetical protein
MNEDYQNDVESHLDEDEFDREWRLISALQASRSLIQAEINSRKDLTTDSNLLYYSHT